MEKVMIFWARLVDRNLQDLSWNINPVGGGVDNNEYVCYGVKPIFKQGPVLNKGLLKTLIEINEGHHSKSIS